MVTRSLVGASLLLGVCACTDDHFDVVNNPVMGGNQTIWQNIKGNPELSEFANLLQRTRVMKNEDDRNATQSFASLLDQPQSFTVWAPLNGTFDATKAKYNQLLLEAAALREAAGNVQTPETPEPPVDPDNPGNPETPNPDAPTPSSYEVPAGLTAEQYLDLADQKEYQVVNQFVRNHISRFQYQSLAGAQDVRLMNTKNSVLSNNQLNGLPIGNDVYYSTNGSLYTLQGANPFAFNIFDFISSSENYSTLYGILTDPQVDHKTFWAAGSTEGAMNENGEMVYVDSVFLYNNDILDAAGAQIKNEDSVYVALIPTNTAWDEAVEKVSALYTYGTTYCYDWDEETGKFLKNGANALKFTKAEMDSLQSLITNETIIRNMFFTPSIFTGVNTADSAQVINYTLHADSLKSTTGTTFYNANKGGENPLFAGINPVKASNGYVFPLETYRVDPAYSFINHTENQAAFMTCSTTGCVTQGGQMITLTDDNRNTEVLGDLADDRYSYYAVSGNSKLTIRFRLNNILSARYKITIQMAPNRINKDHIRLDQNGDTIVEAPKFDVQLLGDDMKTISGTKAVKNIQIDQDKVTNIVLYEDVFFPKNYVGLPSGYSSFPMLEVSMTLAQQKSGNCKALSIGKIIIEPVRD